MDNTITTNSLNIMVTPLPLPALLSVKDIAAIGISRSAFYRLVHREGVPTISIEGRIYIPRDRFIEWIETNTEIN